jgi:hypothetical protein
MLDLHPAENTMNSIEDSVKETVDMRGLCLAHTGMVGHVERIEQCGDRVVAIMGAVNTSQKFEDQG